MTEAQAAEAVRWVGPDGTVRSGHEALAAALGTRRAAWRIVGRAFLLPGVSLLAARLSAGRRQPLPAARGHTRLRDRAGRREGPAARIALAGHPGISIQRVISPLRTS